MERIKRTPYQGVYNIIRFNRHYYLGLTALLLILFFLKSFITGLWAQFVTVIIALAFLSVMLSLLVSYYIYDYSGFYSLKWLDKLDIPSTGLAVNIHAGFDETSSLLREKYPQLELRVMDFYNSRNHTEISIKRARKAYPAVAGTEFIETNYVPLQQSSVDTLFFIFALHEIRTEVERINFLYKCRTSLKPDGCMIIIEHQRNWVNFLAYNIGFFHFYAASTWKENFNKAGLQVGLEYNITPFICAYILTK
jgi:hypothetical protein